MSATDQVYDSATWRDAQIAMLLDAAGRAHDDDWLPRSRGADDAGPRRMPAARDRPSWT